MGNTREAGELQKTTAGPSLLVQLVPMPFMELHCDTVHSQRNASKIKSHLSRREMQTPECYRQVREVLPHSTPWKSIWGGGVKDVYWKAWIQAGWLITSPLCALPTQTKPGDVSLNFPALQVETQNRTCFQISSWQLPTFVSSPRQQEQGARSVASGKSRAVMQRLNCVHPPSPSQGRVALPAHQEPCECPRELPPYGHRRNRAL